jgi:hypothetical protein
MSLSADAVVDPSTLAMLKLLHKLGAATAKTTQLNRSIDLMNSRH